MHQWGKCNLFVRFFSLLWIEDVDATTLKNLITSLWFIIHLIHFHHLHLLSVTSFLPMTHKPVHAPVFAWSVLAAFLVPIHHASLLPPFPTGWGPDLGSEWPQLSEHPTRRGRQGPEVITASNDDGKRRWPPATCQDGGGWDEVDRQLPDSRELCQQQHGQVSYNWALQFWYSHM